MHVGFDLDDTLFYTTNVVEQAYRRAGVVKFPENWNHIPYKEWPNQDPEIHREKNRIYIRKLIPDGWVKPTPLLQIATDFVRAGIPVSVLTGASKDAAHAVMMRSSIYKDIKLLTCLSLEDKVRYLRETSVTGLYFDDDQAVVSAIKERTGWLAYVAS